MIQKGRLIIGLQVSDICCREDGEAWEAGEGSYMPLLMPWRYGHKQSIKAQTQREGAPTVSGSDLVRIFLFPSHLAKNRKSSPRSISMMCFHYPCEI